jgi:flagellar basal-body rod protein FlgC
MISAVHSSVSALKAASASLASRADNIANVRTTARIDEVSVDRSSRRELPEEVFRPSRPTYVAREHGGVDVEIEPVDPSHRVVYDPRDSRANEEGLVAAPNVNLEENLVGAIQDRAMFLANVAVIRTADEMSGALLDEEA